VASGLSWGAASIWLFPQNDIAHQAFLAFVIAGMCAGAVTTLSAILSSSFAFVVLAVTPLLSRWLLIDTTISAAMAVMTVLFTVMMLFTAKRMNYVVKESLRIRYANKLAEEKIRYQAFYDPLTGLPNRRLIIKNLKVEIARSIRHNLIGGVLFLDLDHFKRVNDSLGHTVGDDLLRQVARRIELQLRDEDSVARLGGDEFVILAPEIGEEIMEANDHALLLAEKIRCLFEKPFDVDGHLIHVTVSIGITFFPQAENTPEGLLQSSDVAMYVAKEAGRNKSRLFLPEMQQAVNNQREVEKGLRQALIEGELELYYQPIIAGDSNICAVEALLRWNHPDKGIVSPVGFIEIAEKTSLIINIGDWVLKATFEGLMSIPAKNNLLMCTNVSPRQFGEASFVDKVKKTLLETGVDPRNIRLELTEGMMLDNVEETIEKMELLAEMGVSFAIDDFGTGYSSLSYLKRLPVEALKIDKSFVLDIDHDANDAAIVETVLVMARYMKIDVVAEGVETQEILGFLKAKGCNKFQGYLFNRPMPLIELLELLEEENET
jgi:diguanylate cyclase (GGDEF)-like protein